MQNDDVKYNNGTTSQILKTGKSAVYGFIVNSHTTGTLRLNDGLTTTTAGDKAEGTLTITSTISNNETVKIGTQTYTFKTTLTASTTANEVLIGVSDAVALDNLKSAIDKSAGGGTTYGSETVANADVVGGTNTDTTQQVVAKVVGTDDNSVATTETMSNGSWGATTLAGGTEPAPLVINTFTPATGSSTHLFPNGVSLTNGLYITITGTIDYTVLTD